MCRGIRFGCRGLGFPYGGLGCRGLRLGCRGLGFGGCAFGLLQLFHLSAGQTRSFRAVVCWLVSVVLFLF